MFFVLALMLAAVIFAVQNATVVIVTVFLWRLQASLAIIIGVCVALGAIMGALVTVPHLYRMRGHERRIRAQLAELESSSDSAAPQGGNRQVQPAARR